MARAGGGRRPRGGGGGERGRVEAAAGPAFSPRGPRGAGKGAPAAAADKAPEVGSRAGGPQPPPPRRLRGAAAARQARAAGASPAERPSSCPGAGDPHRATGLGVHPSFPVCGARGGAAPGRVPAPSARRWLLCVAGDRPARWVGDAGSGPPGCARLRTPPSRRAARLPPACSRLTSLSLWGSHKGRGARLSGQDRWWCVCFLCVRRTHAGPAVWSAPEGAGGSRPGLHGLASPRSPWRFDISLWYTDLTLQVGSAVEGVT